MNGKKIKRISLLWTFLLALMWTAFPQTSDNQTLNPAERDKVQRTRSLSDKLKVYSQAIDRHVGRIRQDAADENSAELKADTLAASETIKSAWDEIKRSNEKRKSKHLKKFEIALRKDIQLLKSLQSRSSSAYRDYFTEPIEVAEKTRGEILSLIFEEKSLRKR